MGAVYFRASTILLSLTIFLYFAISKVLFDQIYLTSNIIVDEEFHLPLGEAYCQYDFTKWDPKVTTFPGLYLLSSLVFGMFNLCSTYWLRFTSLICSTFNILLFYLVIKLYNKEISWKNIISALNLAMLPPLYFFSHLYYTDVASITMSLLIILAAKKECHYLASLFGALAIMMRQTNVLWILLVFGDYVVKELHLMLSGNNKSIKNVQVSMKDVGEIIESVVYHPMRLIQKLNIRIILDFLAYLTVIFSFAIFVYLNGSIVVGDKTAHVATIHLPQLFYFSAFTFIFAWPLLLSQIKPFFKFVFNHLILTIFFVTLCFIIIHYNTLVHPYMLADNRHYMFYVWNRFYGKYYLFRYAMSFIYVFALYSILTKIWNKNDISFYSIFVCSVILALVMQKLIEVRYYLFPYILFRIQIKKVSTVSLILESLSYLLINAITLYIFFNKTIIWDTYDYPQRLIW